MKYLKHLNYNKLHKAGGQGGSEPTGSSGSIPNINGDGAWRKLMSLTDDERTREYNKGYRDCLQETVKYLTNVNGSMAPIGDAANGSETVTPGSPTNPSIVELVNHLLSVLEKKEDIQTVDLTADAVNSETDDVKLSSNSKSNGKSSLKDETSSLDDKCDNHLVQNQIKSMTSMSTQTETSKCRHCLSSFDTMTAKNNTPTPPPVARSAPPSGMMSKGSVHNVHVQPGDLSPPLTSTNVDSETMSNTDTDKEPSLVIDDSKEVDGTSPPPPPPKVTESRSSSLTSMARKIASSAKPRTMEVKPKELINDIVDLVYANRHSLSYNERQDSQQMMSSSMSSKRPASVASLGDCVDQRSSVSPSGSDGSVHSFKKRITARYQADEEPTESGHGDDDGNSNINERDSPHIVRIRTVPVTPPPSGEEFSDQAQPRTSSSTNPTETRYTPKPPSLVTDQQIRIKTSLDRETSRDNLPSSSATVSQKEESLLKLQLIGGESGSSQSVAAPVSAPSQGQGSATGNVVSGNGQRHPYNDDTVKYPGPGRPRIYDKPPRTNGLVPLQQLATNAAGSSQPFNGHLSSPAPVQEILGFGIHPNGGYYIPIRVPSIAFEVADVGGRAPGTQQLYPVSLTVDFNKSYELRRLSPPPPPPSSQKVTIVPSPVATQEQVSSIGSGRRPGWPTPRGQVSKQTPMAMPSSAMSHGHHGAQHQSPQHYAPDQGHHLQQPHYHQQQPQAYQNHPNQAVHYQPNSHHQQRSASQHGHHLQPTHHQPSPSLQQHQAVSASASTLLRMMQGNHSGQVPGAASRQIYLSQDGRQLRS